ncbi:hypothetical protein GCM10011358_26780 [Sinisalibacter lacisalsi]|uniref:Uncharacterized protein n=1 Tax=Sinisalibacter lacisalsi TaxID=1526570 RepID=A0ABQ1QQX9_9RHOB|nr:hypothetical protein GCM10011358_26780 [Sinisalibacter lacisalsi]
MIAAAGGAFRRPVAPPDKSFAPGVVCAKGSADFGLPVGLLRATRGNVAVRKGQKEQGQEPENCEDLT